MIDNGRLVERAMMDYVIVERELWIGLWTSMFQGRARGTVLDHFLVVSRTGAVQISLKSK